MALCLRAAVDGDSPSRSQRSVRRARSICKRARKPWRGWIMRTELYIGGAWREGGGERIASHDPATGEKVWEGRAADADDVAEAMAAAHLAFPAWSRRPLEERTIVRAFAKEIEARKDEIAQTISREMGKALWDSRGEVAAMIGKIEISDPRPERERAGYREECRVRLTMTCLRTMHMVCWRCSGPSTSRGTCPMATSRRRCSPAIA
ncbi:MAG: aldehyde dehydrogenase family protein [Hyphomonadaceae bacterium]